MKKSKRMLLELTNLPVVRKTLQTEDTSVKFKDIKPGDILMFPKKSKTKKFIVVQVFPFSGTIMYVEHKGYLMSMKTHEADGVLVSQNGLGNMKPIEA